MKTLILLLAFFVTNCGGALLLKCDYTIYGVCIFTEGLPGTEEEITLSVDEIVELFVAEVPQAPNLNDVEDWNLNHTVILAEGTEAIEKNSARAIMIPSNERDEFVILLKDDYPDCWEQAQSYLVHEFLHVYSYLLWNDVDQNHSNDDFFSEDIEDNTLARIRQQLTPGNGCEEN